MPQVGEFRCPSDKKAKRVLCLHADGLSYRLIARKRGHEQEQAERRAMTRKDWFEVIAVAIAGYPAMKALDWLFGRPGGAGGPPSPLQLGSDSQGLRPRASNDLTPHST